MTPKDSSLGVESEGLVTLAVFGSFGGEKEGRKRVCEWK